MLFHSKDLQFLELTLYFCPCFSRKFMVFARLEVPTQVSKDESTYKKWLYKFYLPMLIQWFYTQSKE